MRPRDYYPQVPLLPIDLRKIARRLAKQEDVTALAHAAPGAVGSFETLASSPAATALNEQIDAGAKAVEILQHDPTAPLTPGQQVGLESVIHLVERPALLIQRGTYPNPVAPWERLGANRVILLASSDYRGSASASDHYASKRGMVVEAALLMEGVLVERRIEVGARLSVKGASDTDRAKSREVLVYTVSEKPAQKLASTRENQP